MKKILLLFVLLTPLALLGQEQKNPNETPSSKRFEYLVYDEFFKRATLSTGDGYLVDNEGYMIEFRNVADILSFFGKDGWELVLAITSHGVLTGGFFFKKDVTAWTDEQISQFLSKYKLSDDSKHRDSNDGKKKKR